MGYFTIQTNTLEKGHRNNHAQLVLPPPLGYEVLVHAHDDLTGGHLGTFKTYEKLRHHFYWWGMYIGYVRPLIVPHEKGLGTTLVRHSSQYQWMVLLIEQPQIVWVPSQSHGQVVDILCSLNTLQSGLKFSQCHLLMRKRQQNVWSMKSFLDMGHLGPCFLIVGKTFCDCQLLRYGNFTALTN